MLLNFIEGEAAVAILWAIVTMVIFIDWLVRHR